MAPFSPHVLVPSRVPWARLADVVTGVCLAVAVIVASTGGFTLALGPLHLAAHDVWRPVAIAGLLTLVRVIATGKVRWLPHAAAAGLLLQAVAAHYEPGAGFTELIAFGRQFESRALPAVRAVAPRVKEGSGYDGQFYAQMAVDPLLRDPATATALDDPGYRARRALFSWTAWLLGLGRPAWVLQAYALQNVLCWLVLAWLLTRWFPVGGGRAFILWFCCLFTEGIVASVRLALVDGPSLLLVALVVVAVEQNRRWLSAGVLALAGVGRETSLLAGVAFLNPGWWREDRVRVLVAQALLAVLPLLLWLAYVRWVVGFDMSWGGSNFAAPFTAYVTKWRVTLGDLASNGFASYARFNLYALVAVTVQGVYVAVRRERQRVWWRVGAAHALLLVVVGWAVWDGNPGAFTRAAMPLTIAFNVQVARERWFWPLAMLGNLTVLHGLEMLRVPWIYPIL